MVDTSSKARLAVDIGGTFTDVVLELPGGGRVTTKRLTTYAHPGQAVLEGIAEVLQQGGVMASQISLIIHGTTLATNALIERSGAVTALLTTEGHRDALEMAHEDRFEQYDVMIDRPKPLVPRYLRLPVRERLDCNGRVLVPLDEGSIRETLPVLEKHQVESVAIGYLHAFVNPEHELRTAEILQAARPDLSITLASEVCPEIREFERLSTACANAYVRPLMARYLERLAGELRELGFACPFLPGLSKLKALRLSGANGKCQVSDAGMAHVAKLPSLKLLAIDSLWISEAGIKHLVPLSNLQELYMADTTIGNEALGLLAGFEKLQKLRIAKNQVDADGIQMLPVLKNLTELDLSECSSVLDDAMPPLAELKGLTKLNLWRLNISDAGVAPIANLTELQWLNLDNTRLSDAGTAHLVGLTKLKFLHLGSTQITDDGLSSLEGLTSLEDLKVTRTEVTAEGVAELKKKLPKTEIQLQYVE